MSYIWIGFLHLLESSYIIKALWNDISLSLNWFSFQTRHGWKIALQLDTSGIAGYGEQESLNDNDHDLGTYLFIVWEKHEYVLDEINLFPRK